MKTKTQQTRCPWCGDDAIYQAYHDTEWGVPETREPKLFEFLLLEGMQAGLSWITILKRREQIGQALAGFDPKVLARFNKRDVTRAMNTPGMIRHELKVTAAINNAKAYLQLIDKGQTLFDLLWSMVDYRVQINRRHSMQDVPAATPLSTQMAKVLKQAQFSFVGPTICYALMQATGMVNDHLQDCYRFDDCVAIAEQCREVTV